MIFDIVYLLIDLLSDWRFTVTASLLIAVLAALTNAQKRQALQELIKAKALAFGVDGSDQAWADMQDLYSNQTPPGSIPPVVIRQ